MRRIKVVLALSALMVAMLVATAGPAIADHENRQDRWEDRWDRWEDRWDDNWWWDNDRWWDNDGPFVASNFNDDCELEWTEGWFLGPWGWQWGIWELDC